MEAAGDAGELAMDHGDPEDPGPGPGDAMGTPVTGAEGAFADLSESGTGAPEAELADGSPEPGVSAEYRAEEVDRRVVRVVTK